MDQLTDVPEPLTFILAHPEFYETISRYALSPEYLALLKELLPSSWSIQRENIWLHCQASREHAERPSVIQGFKIHISATPHCALQVLSTIVPLCADREISFKTAGDPFLLELLNSKRQARGHSGKFVTIYPPDEATFKNFIEMLHQHTKDKDFTGPYILSDRRYKDSAILFYRYGGFHPPLQLNSDGAYTSFLVSPEGEYVPDQRTPYFQLPNWVRDPFSDETEVNDNPGALLKDRYLIEGALGFSNSGGIYFGTDTAAGSSIIIKEARPYTNSLKIALQERDAAYLLEREYRILGRLQELACVPARIDLFREWEHTFLVETRADGITFDAYWARDEVILAPYIRREGRVERFIEKFSVVAARLIESVRAIHQRGVLLGDISTRNILINPESLQLWIIDFESAVVGDDEDDILAYATKWGTDGFVHPQRRSRNCLVPEDDFYAVAMALYNSVVPISYFFVLNPAAQDFFIDRFVDLGVPTEIKSVILSLLRGDAQEALDSLAGLRT